MPDLQKILDAMEVARKALAEFATELPDLDANSTVFCIANDEAERLERVIKEFPAHMKEASRLAKKNPHWTGKKRF